MSSVRYKTGEVAKIGEAVSFAGQKGKIKVVGDGLLQWGLTIEEVNEGRVIIEFENGALLCANTALHDLDLITPSE